MFSQSYNGNFLNSIIVISLIWSTWGSNEQAGNTNSANDPKNKIMAVNPAKIDLFLQSASLMALLKAKAHTIITAEKPKLPNEERAVYEQCASNAGAVIKLAKCVSTLIRTRDKLLYSNNENMIKEDTNWFTTIRNWFRPINLQNKKKQANNHNPDTKSSPGNLTTFNFSQSSNNTIPQALNFSLTGIKYYTKKHKINLENNNINLNSKQLPIFALGRTKSSPSHEIRKNIKTIDKKKRTIMSNKTQLTEDFLKLQERRRHRYIQDSTKFISFSKHKRIKRSTNTTLKESDHSFRIVSNEEDTNKKTFDTPKSFETSYSELNTENLFASAVNNIKKEQRISSKNKTLTRKYYRNIEKVKQIQEYIVISKHCDQYMKEVVEDNKQYLKNFDDGYMFDVPDNKDVEKYRFSSELEKEWKDIGAIPILSPKLFSFIPEKKSNKTNAALKEKIRNMLLSPNLFSFNDEGILSLSSLFKLISTDEMSELDLIEKTLTMFGVDKTLDRILDDAGPKITELRSKIYPTILKIQALQNRFKKVHLTLTDEQKRALEKSYYTFLSPKQLRILHDIPTDYDLNRKSDQPRKTDTTVYLGECTDRSTCDIMDETTLEDDIHQIAVLTDDDDTLVSMLYQPTTPRAERLARKAPMFADPSDFLDKTSILNPEEKEGEKLERLRINTNILKKTEKIRLLQRFTFNNRLRDGIAFQNVVLSPSYFTPTVMQPGFGLTTILSPRFFGTMILSPRAAFLFTLSPQFFIFNILSTYTMWFDLLSPRFFQVNILAPRAFIALIMSPRTFLFDILSPKAFELKVLSPSTLFFITLSPFLFHFRVFSPPILGAFVLSPTLLSPSLNSQGIMTAHILSPKILSPEIDLQKIDLRHPDSLARQFEKGLQPDPNPVFRTSGLPGQYHKT